MEAVRILYQIYIHLYYLPRARTVIKRLVKMKKCCKNMEKKLNC